MKHIRRNITFSVLGTMLFVFAVLLATVNIFIPEYLTSEARKAIIAEAERNDTIPFDGARNNENGTEEHFLTPSVRYLEVDGGLTESEHLSKAEYQLREYCRKENPAADEFHTLKTGGSRFVFRLTRVEANEYEKAYSYVLYVDVGAVMQYSVYLNAVFFAVLAILSVLVCLFGWKLGGYVERAHESQKWFFQNVSHELKTPMMAVQGCAEGIHTGVLDPVGASGIILEETEQMSELVEELLALSRLESGQANAEFHLTDVRELLYDCLRSTEQPAEQKNLRISLRFDETPVLVNCDEVQLRRAFTNIITNAQRYAKEEIQIECKADKGKAVVRIRDDGEGIAPKLLPHIFDRFFSTSKGGTGIGLSLAKEIVSLHKGTIHAANDGGAVFEINLPMK
jgi:two-component sensor histidine kinase